MNPTTPSPRVILVIAAMAVLGAACATAPMSSVGRVTRTATPGPNSPPAATRDPREPDLAGKFDVGGHSLYIECRGTTGPVIVFEAGSGSTGATWNRSRKDFVGLVDDSFRRCTYDRANLGKSDRVEGARTSATASDELHALLLSAGLPPPYVLVGRSFGGYNVRLFAAEHPREVTALVLIETLTPEFHTGVGQALSPEQWATELESFDAIEPPLDEVASASLVAAAPLPDVPALIVAGTKWHSGNAPWPDDWPGAALDALWDQAQQDLAARFPRGRLVVFEGGDHSLHVSQPERLARELNAFLAGL